MFAWEGLVTEGLDEYVTVLLIDMCSLADPQLLSSYLINCSYVNEHLVFGLLADALSWLELGPEHDIDLIWLIC